MEYLTLMASIAFVQSSCAVSGSQVIDLHGSSYCRGQSASSREVRSEVYVALHFSFESALCVWCVGCGFSIMFCVIEK